MNRTDSRAIARRRGVGTVPILTRDATATLPPVDMSLDLAAATGEQLEAQRVALIARISAGDTDSGVVERAQAVAAQLTAYNARVAAADTARSALLAGRVAHSTNPSPETGDEPRDDQPVRLGRAFTSSPAFRAYAAAPQGKAQIIVPGAVRSLFGTANFPSQPTRVPGIMVPTRDERLTVLDLIDRQSIDSNTVEWVQETGYPNSAAFVAEGGAKPESTFGFELKQDSTQVVAHWVNFTRQVLSDESQVQGYVEGRLSYGLMRKLNEQVISGDGIAPNLRGIISTVGIGTYTAPASEDPLISVRRARTVAELSEYYPDAVVMNPVEWERIELSTDLNGQFKVVAANISTGATPRLWGLSVVLSIRLTASIVGTGGKFLVGAFREGATLWERNGVEFYLTDSHASNFTSNIITLLAELRCVLSVWRPKAFVYGTFAALAA